MQRFGGNWTQQKLTILEKYLRFYNEALKNQNFERVYIDAFAGSGSRTAPTEPSPPTQDKLFPQLDEDAADDQLDEFLDGSARIALKTEPSFAQFVFVEQNADYLDLLKQLRQEFPEKAQRMDFHPGDANTFLRTLPERDWYQRRQRGVLFLDPYGMQVSWDSLRAVAATEAIDVWYLFPLGMGPLRLLKKNGDISDAHRQRLDDIFGEPDWFDAMYQPTAQRSLFEDEQGFQKTADIGVIRDYVIQRLKEVFPGVANNPLILRNSKNSPLYLFCFAVSNPNPKARGLALKVAQHILNSENQ
jgi:three-Cys-motif partner protein